MVVKAEQWPNSGPKLLDRVREAIRTRHYSCRTEEAYAGHSFATHLLEAGYDIRTIQELLGHMPPVYSPAPDRRSGTT